MSGSHEILALIFDFDDTLVPDSTTKLLEEHGIDAGTFWSKDVAALVATGFDPAHAYLKLVLDNIGPGKPLAGLTNQKLRDFGKKLDPLFFPGLQTLFDDLRTQVGEFADISIEFYIISGGLQEVMEGCGLVRKYFKAVYGCQLVGDTADRPLKYIKRCITFTEKTRFIFEINKGITPGETKTNPLAVNKDVKEDRRRIPIRNMIYAGDGLTDIPCFSLLNKNNGSTYGVFHKQSARKALLELLKTDRVMAVYTPKFGPDDDLGIILRTQVSALCTQIELRRKQTET